MSAYTHGDDEISGTSAGWRYDPVDPHLLRWHDGQRFTDEQKPRLAVAAEDQVRLLGQIREDVNSIKSLVMVLAVVALLGAVGSIAAAFMAHA